MAFSEFGVMEEIDQAVQDIGWMLPTDIQAESIPLILGGGDVLMAAETGSGKTGAFSIPVIQIVHESKSAKTVATGSSSWELNVADRDDQLNICGNLAQCRDLKKWFGCRSTFGVTKSGRYFYEVKCRDQGLSRIGFSKMNANLNLGMCGGGFGFGGTGKKSNNKNFISYGEPYGLNDTIAVFDIEVFCVRISRAFS